MNEKMLLVTTFPLLKMDIKNHFSTLVPYEFVTRLGSFDEIEKITSGTTISEYKELACKILQEAKEKGIQHICFSSGHSALDYFVQQYVVSGTLPIPTEKLENLKVEWWKIDMKLWFAVSVLQIYPRIHTTIAKFLYHER